MKLIEVADDEKTGRNYLRQLLLDLATIFPGKFVQHPGKTVAVAHDNPHRFLEVMNPHVREDTIDISVNFMYSVGDDAAEKLAHEINDKLLSMHNDDRVRMTGWPTSQSLDGFITGWAWHLSFPKKS